MAVPAIAAGAMAALGFIGPMFVHSLFSIIISASPLAEFTRQQFNLRYAIFLAGPGDLVRERLLGTIDGDMYESLMKRHGFDATQTANMLAGAELLLTASELVFANFRKIIDDNEYERQMHRHGYSDDSLAAFKEVSRFFPSVGDLVTFAVREVYTPEIRTEYGLDADWPEQFGTEAAKAGLPEEQARNFWAAHWKLPSIQMGYEMMHRKVISPDQLKTLLKTQDIMPFWREPLMEISYRTLTRVDVRRMYRLDVLDPDGVKDAYLDQGYNEENADRMTEFTIRYETQEEKTLTKGEILKAFRRHVFGVEEAIEWLVGIKYSQEIAELHIMVEESSMVQADTDEAIDLLVDQYVDGQIDKAKLEDELGMLELPAGQYTNILWKADRKKQRAVKMPSIADIRRWVDEGSITRDSGLTMLSKLNIPSEYVPLYLGERERLPSISDIRRWYADDTIPQERAEQLLAQHRVPPEFISFYLKVKEEKERLPSVGDIRTWVKTGIIDKGRGEELLALLKVPEEFVPLYLQEKTYTPSLKDIQLWYSEEYIDEAKAKQLLTQIGIPSELHEFYLAERTRTPTIRNIQKWYEEGEITRDRATQLLRSINVSEEFIDLYLLEWTQLPSVKTVQYWYQEGMITETDARGFLVELHIPPQVHEYYLEIPMRVPSIKDIQKWYKAEFVTRGEATTLLQTINVRPDYIELYLREVEGEE